MSMSNLSIDSNLNYFSEFNDQKRIDEVTIKLGNEKKLKILDKKPNRNSSVPKKKKEDLEKRNVKVSNSVYLKDLYANEAKKLKKINRNINLIQKSRKEANLRVKAEREKLKNAKLAKNMNLVEENPILEIVKKAEANTDNCEKATSTLDIDITCYEESTNKSNEKVSDLNKVENSNSVNDQVTYDQEIKISCENVIPQCESTHSINDLLNLTVNISNLSLKVDDENVYNESAIQIDDILMKAFEKHKRVLSEYFKENKEDKHLSALFSEECDEMLKMVICLPSLYDKYGKKLLKLFDNKSFNELQSHPSSIDRRIVGELAYQLEQRIFYFIFQIEPLNRRYAYDCYQPLNIKDTIFSMSKNEIKGEVDRKKLQNYLLRYEYLMRSLLEVGYDELYYQDISSLLIIKYSVFPCLPADCKIYTNSFDELDIFFEMLIYAVDETERDFLIILYTCLLLIAYEDGQPLLIWD